MTERRKLDTILLNNKLVSEEQLKQIISYAHAVGIDLHEAVLQKKIAPPDAVMMAYAESIGLPFINLADVAIDTNVAAQIDPMTARQHSFVPISIDQGYVLLATTKPIIPDVAEELRMTFDLPVRCVLCTPAELGVAIAAHYPRGAVRIPQIIQKQAPASKPVPKAQKLKPTEPMNEEEINDRFWKSVIAFNFSFAFVCFAMNYMKIPGIYNSWYFWLVLVLLGGIAGGLAAFVTWMKLSR